MTAAVPAGPARPVRSAPVDTHCPYCALQCATTLTPDPVGADGVAGVTVAGRAFPTNRGGLCQKGWTAGAVLRAGDRLTTPLVRGRHLGRTGAAADVLEPTTWGTALDLVATTVRRVQAESGHDAVAVFGGGGLTNEKAYALGRSPGPSCAPRASTTTAGSACRRPRPRATAPSGWTGACRSR